MCRRGGRGHASASLVRTGRRGCGARVASTEPARISANGITTAAAAGDPAAKQLYPGQGQGQAGPPGGGQPLAVSGQPGHAAR